MYPVRRFGSHAVPMTNQEHNVSAEGFKVSPKLSNTQQASCISIDTLIQPFIAYCSPARPRPWKLSNTFSSPPGRPNHQIAANARCWAVSQSYSINPNEVHFPGARVITISTDELLGSCGREYPSTSASGRVSEVESCLIYQSNAAAWDVYDTGASGHQAKSVKDLSIVFWQRYYRFYRLTALPSSGRNPPSPINSRQ